jgi:hypothetical protein
MPKDGFEHEIEGLFTQAPRFSDDEAFVQAVSARTARLRRTERLVHGAAATIGGAIAVYQLAQPGLWTGFYGWLTQTTVPLANPQLWTAPDPTSWAVILGAGLLAAYVVHLLREA